MGSSVPPPTGRRLRSHGEHISRETKIAIIGRPNVGKSTLINRILGENRMVAFDQPGTTRDSVLVPFERDGERRMLKLDVKARRMAAAPLATARPAGLLAWGRPLRRDPTAGSVER